MRESEIGDKTSLPHYKLAGGLMGQLFKDIKAGTYLESAIEFLEGPLCEFLWDFLNLGCDHSIDELLEIARGKLKAEREADRLDWLQLTEAGYVVIEDFAQAAKITVGHVRTMCRKGRIWGLKQRLPPRRNDKVSRWRWIIPEEELFKYLTRKQRKGRRGK